jgi:hypothetical protein
MSLQKVFVLQTGDMGYAKIIMKKWTSARDIENNGYSDARLKKEREKENIYQKDSP